MPKTFSELAEEWRGYRTSSTVFHADYKSWEEAAAQLEELISKWKHEEELSPLQELRVLGEEL